MAADGHDAEVIDAGATGIGDEGVTQVMEPRVGDACLISTQAASGVSAPVEGMESDSPQAFGKIWIFGCSSSTPKWWVSSSQSGLAGQWPQPLVDPEPLDLADIQRAAEDQDHRAFAQLARAIQWEKRPPNDLIRTVNLALSLEMLRLARDLVGHGRKLFPNEKRLQRLAVVLAPPVILGTRQSQPAGLVSSQRWLKEHASEYRNQWIAGQDGRLLGAAPTLRELHQKIGPAGKAVRTIIVKVLPDGVT